MLLLFIFILGAAGCSLIRPRPLRPNWKWDGRFRVMPNSIFEPVAKAREVESEPARAEASSGPSLREELSLDGPWRYRPDPDESGETEHWQAPDYEDSGWKTMAVPNNYSIDDLSLKNFYQPVWFRRSFELPASPCRGDAHNWLVWHLKGNLENYFADPAQLISEFGLQAPPDLETLRHFLPGGLLWPVGKGWTHHHLSRAKMEKYVRHFGGPAKTIEDFINAGQAAQAHYLHRAIEQWRRQKYAKSGAMFWQWNDPWPCVSWSVVDYFLRPKKAYDAVRPACQPLLVSAEFEQRRYNPGGRLEAKIIVVNDLPKNFPKLEAEVTIGGRLVKTISGSVGADEVADLGMVMLDLPAETPPLLSLVLKEDGHELARNQYDLSSHDPEPAGLLARRLFKRWWQFLGG